MKEGDRGDGGRKEEKKEKEKEGKKKENCCRRDGIEGSIRGPCGPKKIIPHFVVSSSD